MSPDYVKGHNLLADKSVLITAAAGTGIGFAAAKKAAEEGCRGLYISADTIYGGTNQIQRNIIAERGLGLPREPRST